MADAEQCAWRRQDGELWVFAYGSLMWRPGFAYVEMQPATLYGYHRALCIYSWLYRGTRRRPGLVLGLDRGGSCIGRAFRVTPARASEVEGYLHDREMEYEVYRQVASRLRLADGRRVTALAHVVNRSCAQYAGRLAEHRMVALVRQGRGAMGPCRDYLANAVAHLDELGLADGVLHRLLDRVGAADG